ncbi:DUF3977 family protein [Paenibacillus sp. FSL K6-0276]|uniref:DUF3977 family protein n=1 Tax=Paenibacillus sp. FSL K6-0276 TaxID=2921450 RepID=UPI0030EEAE51
MKYLEIGYGNKWFVRTEIEDCSGNETEYKGIVRPFKPRSIYIRIWINKQVVIIDSREGYKTSKKTKASLKILLGMTSK